MHNNILPWKRGTSHLWSGTRDYPFPFGVYLFLSDFFRCLGVKKKPRPSPPRITSKPKNVERTPTKPIKEETEVTSEEWKESLSQQAMAVSFPRGGKIALDPQKDTPFILKLPHKTHQAYKDSIHIFAQWLSNTPTPKRIIIRFDAGCSENEQQLVRAAFRKYYHINEIIIRKETNQIDIFFHHPDQKWGRKYNLNKDFR